MSIEEQIAREAAEKWDLRVLSAVKCRLRPEDKVELETIILAAIKRAVAIEREIVKHDHSNSGK